MLAAGRPKPNKSASLQYCGGRCGRAPAGFPASGWRPLIGSIDLAIQKAFTARVFDISTGDLAELAQPGKPLYGIRGSNEGKIVIFGGGLPIRRKGVVIGAIGTSAGTVEQDELADIRGGQVHGISAFNCYCRPSDSSGDIAFVATSSESLQ